MKAATDKAQRHLHRLSCRAEEVLKHAAAGVLASASKAIGMGSLKSTPEPSESQPAPNSKPKSKKSGQLEPQASAADPLAPCIDRSRWRDACDKASKAAISGVSEQPAGAGAAVAPRVARLLQLQDASLYQNKLPALNKRLPKVVESKFSFADSSPQPEAGAAGEEVAADAESPAQQVDDMAASAAQRAAELAADVEKGARLRKKKALNDLLKVLAEMGVSKHTSSIPSGALGGK